MNILKLLVQSLSWALLAPRMAPFYPISPLSVVILRNDTINGKSGHDLRQPSFEKLQLWNLSYFQDLFIYMYCQENMWLNNQALWTGCVTQDSWCRDLVLIHTEYLQNMDTKQSSAEDTDTVQAHVRGSKCYE